MDPNDPKKPPMTDQEIKDAARHGRSAPGGSSRPGVVPVNEAAALDQRIAEKTGSATAASAPAPAPRELSQLERDISSKQKNAPGIAAAVKPGAHSSQPSTTPPSAARAELSNFESDVAAKQRARAPNVSAVEGLDQKVAAKVATAAFGNRELRDLEASVQDKLNANTRAGNNSVPEYSHAAAASAAAGKPSSRDDLSRLDERIAAKSASAIPRSLQETEDIVTKKKTNTALSGGIQTAPLDKSAPEQNPQQAKEDLLEPHPQGLQPHGDVEYGEFGGPTEQGLAVAFAVEEETEDAFIPAAIEYDPDAKPPLIKNRRFRLYAFLVVIAVLVGTISAAVGITLAGMKTKYDITERDTSGIREAIEIMIGAEKLQDPTSPYAKALDWIQYRDALQLVPGDDAFAQRFVIALLYFSTSVRREWAGGCAPAKQNETDDCIYEKVIEVTVDAGNSIVTAASVRWLSKATECAWAGIQCSESKHIRSIDLGKLFLASSSLNCANNNKNVLTPLLLGVVPAGPNMTGTLPDELEQLNFLQSLTIRFNELGGPLPEKFNKLRHLIHLDLTGNQFTGTIPDSYFTSPVLQRINLSKNRLNGTISSSVGMMVDAKELYLAFNAFSGTIPTEIGRLRSMSAIWLRGNRMNGTIPTEFGNLKFLGNILFDENEFTGVLPSTIGEMSNLADFKIGDNKLTGQIPSSMYRLQRLYQLDLSKNQLSGTISPDMGNMTSLDNLLLRFNDFSGTFPSTLASLKYLDNIQISGNRFNGTISQEYCPAERGAKNLVEIKKLTADCLEDVDGTLPEIECTCCSTCCDRNATLVCVDFE
jgi:Leucine rich repeat